MEHFAPNDRQTTIKAPVVSMAISLRQTEWLLFRKMEQNGLPLTLLVFLVWWLAITSVGFGLFAQPPNPTVVVTLALEAIAVFSAIFIILEMYRPIQRSVEHCADPNSGRAECDGMLKHADSWVLASPNVRCLSITFLQL
jgi:hypothetical protein